MAENRLRERSKRRRRLDPELVSEPCTHRLVHVERFGMAAGRVQRAHQVRVQPLAQRIVRSKCLQFRDQLGVASQEQLGLHALLGCGDPQLLEPLDRRLCERLVPEVGERLAAPERQRA